MIYTISKSFAFEAAHRLPQHRGKCRRLHGHSYRVEVAISGVLQSSGPSQGMIMDFDELSLVVRPLLAALDHHYLNRLFDRPPTAEHIASCLAEGIARQLPSGVRLAHVRVYETLTSYAEARP